MQAIGLFLVDVRALGGIPEAIRDREGDVTIEELRDRGAGGIRRFDRLPFSSKIEELEMRYGISSDLVPEIRSMVAARNCLEHRRGVVSQTDANVENGLVLSWRRLELSDGTIEIVPGTILSEPTEVRLNPRSPRHRRFEQGDVIDLSTDDFTDLCWTIQLFAIELTSSLEASLLRRDIQRDDGVIGAA